MSRPLYWTCPFCDSNLDFGEKCDCLQQKQKKINKKHQETMKILEGGKTDEGKN